MTTYELIARQRKARKMADALLAQAPAAFWLSSEAAHPAPVAFWTQVAEVAGCQTRKPPSSTTWAAVLDELRTNDVAEADAWARVA